MNTNTAPAPLPTIRVSATFERHDAFHGSYDIIAATDGEFLVNYYPAHDEEAVELVGGWLASREEAHRAVARHSLRTVATPLLRAYRVTPCDLLPGTDGEWWGAVQVIDSRGSVGRWSGTGATPGQATLNAWTNYTYSREQAVSVAAHVLATR